MAKRTGLTKKEREELKKKVLSPEERERLMQNSTNVPWKHKKLNDDEEARALLEADDMIRSDDKLKALRMAADGMNAEAKRRASRITHMMARRYEGCHSVPQVDAVFHRFERQVAEMGDAEDVEFYHDCNAWLHGRYRAKFAKPAVA